MMTVRLRLAALLARWALFDREKPPEAVSRLPLKVWLADCDINRHMNNSRYLALMDMGRWHFLLTTQLYKPMRAKQWYPVAVRVEIDYKKSLNPGDRFVLETQQETVGTKSATILQRFWRGDELCAEARVVVLFLHKGKSQVLAELMAEVPVLAQQTGDVREELTIGG
jgi:YbgC/YbaW family acyl-CoA thioester hydrolase